MIDLGTLLLAAIATDVVLAATLFIAARRGVRDGLGSWFGSLGVRVAALGLFSGMGKGSDPAIVVVATALLALCLTLQAAALLEFVRRKLPTWVHSAILAGTALPLALLSGAPAAQVLFGGLAIGTMLLVIAGVALQIHAPISRPTRVLMIGAFALGAAVFYARGISAPWSSNVMAGFAGPSVFQSLTFMLAYVSMFAASCGFLLMSKERADTAAERLASLDPLTGAYNRRTFHETAERTLALARRTGQPLSIIMLDIDHFKGINDKHGHRIGDEVLRVLAEIVRSQLRKEDLLVRFGGDELCIMLPQVPGPGAVVVAGRIRKAVCAEPLRLDGREIVVTVSAGVAARLDEGPESIDELLRRADEALSLAKNRGRNRVVALSLGRSVAA